MAILEIILVFAVILIVGGLTWMSLNRNTPVHKTEGKKKSPFALKDFSMETAGELSMETSQYQQKSDQAEELCQSPGGYEEQKITAMVRDPYWIFAFWEKDEYQENWRDSHPVLRVYEAKGSLHDIFINEDANSWYINVEKPETTFWVERGRLFSNNLFIPIARSNKVTTPRDRVSEIVDEEWLLLAEHEKKLYERLTFTSGPSSPEAISSPVK